MHRPGMLSIWFFIGIQLLIFGILILIASVIYPVSEHPVVLAELHASTWWGFLLLILGLFYTIKFRPGKG